MKYIFQVKVVERGHICETHLVTTELRHLMPAALKHRVSRVTVAQSYIEKCLEDRAKHN